MAFLVNVTGSSNCDELIKNTRLANQIVVWERIAQRNIVQCFNCQKIGHIAKYCNLKYRCVKCNIEHLPGECAIREETRIPRKELFCVNCKKSAKKFGLTF